MDIPTIVAHGDVRHYLLQNRLALHEFLVLRFCRLQFRSEFLAITQVQLQCGICSAMH